MDDRNGVERARRRLKRQVGKYPGGATAVAEALGCTREYLYMLMSGETDKRPGLDFAASMETLLRVPMKWWARPAVSAV